MMEAFFLTKVTSFNINIIQDVFRLISDRYSMSKYNNKTALPHDYVIRGSVEGKKCCQQSRQFLAVIFFPSYYTMS